MNSSISAIARAHSQRRATCAEMSKSASDGGAGEEARVSRSRSTIPATRPMKRSGREGSLRHRGRPTLAAAVAGVLLSIAGVSPAPLEAGSSPVGVDVTVLGQVVDEQTGSGLRGVIVEARPSGRHTLTDENGRFRLPLPAGDYVVVASLLGYQEDQKVITVKSDAAPVLVFRLRPDPVLLEGIRVVADRFESRRHSIPLSSRVLDRDRLVHSGGQNLAEFVLSWGGVFRADCPVRRGLVHPGCVLRRGRVIQPTVYIDDQQAMGGVDQLAMFQPGQMHHVEVYAMGQMIRVYTEQYVEAVAKGKRRIAPLMW